MSRIGFLAFTCLLAGRAVAQLDAGAAPLADLEPEVVAVDDRVDLHGAVARAQQRNPNAAIAAAELRRAADLVEQARAASIPTLGVYGEYARLGPNSLAGVGAVGAGVSASNGQSLAALENYLAGAVLNVPLLAPLAWVQWAHAANDREVASWSEKEFRRQLALDVAHAYLSVIAAKRIVDSNRRASETDRAHYNYARLRFLGGRGTPLDEMRARQQYENDRSAFQSSILGLERAQEALGVLLGEDHPVDAVDEPEFQPLKPSPEGLEEGLRRAPDLRVDLQRADARERADRQVTRDDWADFVPVIVGSFQPAYQSPALVPNIPLTWEFLLTLNWTLYDGGLRYGQHKERSERLFESEKAREGRALQVDSEVRLGFKAVRRTQEALQAAQAAAVAAHSALDVANVQFKAGATTNIDVVDAERRAHDADTIAARVEDDARQARLDLLGALGRFP